jgi:hypothetical protein
MQTKLEKLLRYHRQHVFDDKTGDLHARAIVRLKRTRTFKDMCQRNDDAARQRTSERWLSMYA